LAVSNLLLFIHTIEELTLEILYESTANETPQSWDGSRASCVLSVSSSKYSEHLYGRHSNRDTVR
jgi:hypothetical protein